MAVELQEPPEILDEQPVNEEVVEIAESEPEPNNKYYF